MIHSRGAVSGVASQHGRSQEKEWEVASLHRLHRSQQVLPKGPFSFASYRQTGRRHGRALANELHGRALWL